jgi:hypothetical protein
MARQARIRPGDLVLDPMCGFGTVPIEATDHWPSSFCLAADLHPRAVDGAAKNLAHMAFKVRGSALPRAPRRQAVALRRRSATETPPAAGGRAAVGHDADAAAGRGRGCALRLPGGSPEAARLTFACR